MAVVGRLNAPLSPARYSMGNLMSETKNETRVIMDSITPENVESLPRCVKLRMKILPSYTQATVIICLHYRSHFCSNNF